MMFPVWFLQLIVFVGILLSGLGALALVVFLIVDTKDKKIW